MSYNVKYWKRKMLVEVQEWALNYIELQKATFACNRHLLITEEQENGDYLITIDVWRESQGGTERLKNAPFQSYRLIWNEGYRKWMVIILK